MRSQKLSNRAPRPFKTKTDRWSGIRENKSFLAAAKGVLKSDPTKSQSTSPAETPVEKSADSPANGK
jgi:hypothetical protein